MTGTVRFGINNIYTVDVDGRAIECRIKGKVLKEDETSYNPIAVGDRVEIETDPHSAAKGNILTLQPRRNALFRWNKKKLCVQTIASNVDHLVIVASIDAPPFRPRFVDRMIIAGTAGGVSPLVVINKCDLGPGDDVRARAEIFRACDYPVFFVSAITREGLDEFAQAIRGKTSVFSGQSGAGKTSLLNALVPGLGRKVGEISAKSGKGAHTTSFAQMVDADGFVVIDTPGIRELEIAGIEPDDLRFYFPEFKSFQERCAFPSCLHQHEPDCAVKAALEAGQIPADRFESYARILADLEERKRGDMIEHALSLLEFDRVRQAVAELASGMRSRELLLTLPLLYSRAEVEAELEKSRALRRLLDDGKTIPDLPETDLSQCLRVLAKPGTVLDTQSLAAIARHIHAASALKRFLCAQDVAACIRLMAEKMSVPSALGKEISRVLDPDGAVILKAVPALAKINDTIRRLKNDIERLAAQYLSDPASAGLFQTNAATVKDGRTVLPLKAKHKGRLKGIVHEVSGRGATLFLEPEAIVEKNNELVLQENLFLAELHNLLRELTAQAREELADLRAMFELECVFDILLAKARYAREHNATGALFSENEIILREARHPLLGPGAIPISLSLAPDCQVLLVTGPNTGGKTVTLKTAGLLACMNQFGMEIPASEGTTLPVFDCVFADIGDEQSLAQSLSTFQAHMKNMARIVSHATTRSLVLLDELGAGTDPQEGTAIAMALLDHFVEKKTKTLATTHHGILKNYGFSKPGVLNASVEFDVERLEPTYRLIMGIPGESHALTIAKRNGVSDAVIERARHYLDGERSDIGKLIEELVSQKKKLLEAGAVMKEKDIATEEKLRVVELKELTLRQRERELRKAGIAELSAFLSAARRDLERIVREIREGAHENAIKEGRELLSRLEEQIESEEKKIESLEPKTPVVTSAPLSAGSRVLLRDSGKEGLIVRVQKDGKFAVETGSVRVTLKQTDLEPLDKKADDNSVEVVYTPSAGATVPVFELNVRGFRYADALRSLEKQIDAVLVAGIREFSVLHGKGTGALQQGIHEYLSQCPYVESFRFSLPEHGGSGKTMVKMK